MSNYRDIDLLQGFLTMDRIINNYIKQNYDIDVKVSSGYLYNLKRKKINIAADIAIQLIKKIERFDDYICPGFHYFKTVEEDYALKIKTGKYRYAYKVFPDRQSLMNEILGYFILSLSEITDNKLFLFA